MTGILVKAESGWHCYKGRIHPDNWLCCMPTKKCAVEVGAKNGCTSFILGKREE